MASEIQNTTSVGQEQTSTPISAPAPATSQDQFAIKFHIAVGEAAKYTVFVIFVLYSIGFIIWHSFLGSYGVSSVAFLQTEYLAAAFCYLFLLATFAIPPILIFGILLRNLTSKGAIYLSQWDKGWIPIVGIWFILSSRVTNIFFPSSGLTDNGFVILYIFLGVVTVHLIVSIFCGVKGGLMKRLAHGNNWKETETARIWKNSRTYKFFVRYEFYGLYILIFIFVGLFFNPAINHGFLFSTMFLYLIVTSSFGSNYFETWNSSNRMMRILISTLTCLIFISNVQSFAVNQFGKIPKNVGGGKPETAYVKFSSQFSNVATSLNIPTATSVGLPDGFVGPIGILLRSDKEILFVNYADENSSNYMTNEVPTGLSKTNFIELLVTNQTKVVKTLQPDVLCQFNVHITKNNLKMTAKQIRADLVDAIIFTR